MGRSGTGISAKAKSALKYVALASVAGVSLAGAAHADEAMATANSDGSSTVSTVDVRARKKVLDGAKYTAQPLNTPQTVTVISRGTMEAQNLLSLRDVLSTVPGITFGAGEGGGGFGDSINLRGYSANNDIGVDGVRDSAQYSRSDPFNLEQIEVTNGANSVYAGSGAVGGTINLVSKRPGRRDNTTVQAAAGTENYFRGTLDMNQRLNEGVAVRLNAMAHRNDVPGRDVEKLKRWGVAPSITIGMHSPTQFTAMYLHQEDTNTPAYGVPFYNGRAVPGVDPSNYYGYANLDTQKQKVDMLTGIIDHDFRDGLKLRNLSRYQRVTQHLIVDPPQGIYCLANGQKPVAWSQSTTATNITGYAPCTGTDPAPGFYAPSGPRGNYRDTENELLYNQTDLTWTGQIGGMSHDLVIGAAFLSETFHLDNGNILRNANGTAITLPAMNIAAPNNIWSGAVNYIQGGGAAPTAATATAPSAFPAGAQDGKRQNQAVYLFDNITLAPKWSVNFGLRYEHNEGENYSSYYTSAGYLPNPAGGIGPGVALAGAPGGVLSGTGPVLRSKDNLFSYRAGLVYKPVANASLYVAYGNSRTPSQATVNGSGACTVATCTVDPEKAENIEVGGKWDTAGGLSLTLALFENNRTNYKVASNDPALPDQQLDGSAQVRGLALGASGRITPQWSVFANYTYLHSKVVQGVSDFDRARGLDFTAGDALLQVPNHAFSLFTTYDLPNHVQLGYGVTYQGEYFLNQHGLVTGSTNTRTTIPLVKTEDYFVHRATIAWSPTRTIEIRANLNNIFNKTYYTRIRNNGWATPGDKRSANVTVSYRF